MPTVDQASNRIPPRSTRITCAVDGRDHLINEQATAAGLSAGHGEYVAACGHLVVAVPMVNPPGPSCAVCETAVRGIVHARDRRPGLMARLLPRRL